MPVHYLDPAIARARSGCRDGVNELSLAPTYVSLHAELGGAVSERPVGESAMNLLSAVALVPEHAWIDRRWRDQRLCADKRRSRHSAIRILAAVPTGCVMIAFLPRTLGVRGGQR